MSGRASPRIIRKRPAGLLFLMLTLVTVAAAAASYLLETVPCSIGHLLRRWGRRDRCSRRVLRCWCSFRRAIFCAAFPQLAQACVCAERLAPHSFPPPVAHCSGIRP